MSFDGTLVQNAQISNCLVKVTTGNFALADGGNEFTNCHFQIFGPAEKARQLVKLLQS